MEYTVAQSDSIERIAAAHDCTVGDLMKMNRLAMRMVNLVFMYFSFKYAGAILIQNFTSIEFV